MASLSHTLSSSHRHEHEGSVGIDSAGLPPNPLFTFTPWWGRPPRLAERPVIPYLSEWLAALVAVSLLLVFFFVVRESVAQSERLRVAMSVHSAATHQCRSLAAAGSGEACLRLLKTPADSANAGVAQAHSIASIAAR